MKKYNENQNFNLIVSTKNTAFGIPSSAFTVTYASVDDIASKTVVTGGAVEALSTISTAHTAKTTSAASYGAVSLNINSSTSTIVAGDTIEYASGMFAYVSKVVSGKIYLYTPIRANVASGATLTQVGNEGVYATSNIAIPTSGEFLVQVSAPEYGIDVEERISINAPATVTTPDANAPVYAGAAVAY